MPSMDDIAKVAGVSKATVSLALNDHTRISDETKQKIKAIAKEIGYVQRPVTPKATAARVRRKPGTAIGVLYIGEGQGIAQFFRETLSGISEYASRSGVPVVMIGMFAVNETTDAAEVYDKVIDAGVSGIIVVSASAKLYGLELLADRQFPMVFVGNRRLADRETALHCVSSDNYDGGVIATEYLLRLGHRRIAVLMGKQSLPWEHDRANGFFSAMRQAGAAADEGWLMQVSAHYDPEDAAWGQLARLQPTALMATNMILGHMALSHCRAIGKSVPEEMSILVFDDTDFFPLEQPPVTVIRQDLESLGTVAAEMLLELIAQPEQPARQLLLPVELVTRASCAQPLCNSVSEER